MATDFFSGLLDDEEKKKNGDVSSSPENQTQQESAIVDAGNQTPQQPGQGTRSGSFTNLQSYLDANESAKFGKQVAGQVQSGIDDANSLSSDTKNQFMNRADQSAVGLNQGVLNKVASNPYSVYDDKEQRNAYTKMRDAYYQGPKSFSDASDLYSPLNQAVSKSTSAATQAQNEGGRKALLDSYYGSGAGRYDYTSGQKKLDNYLIQVDPQSRGYFKDVADNASSLNNNFNTLTGYLNSYGKQKADETANTRSQARSALGIDDNNEWTGGGAYGKYKNDVEGTYNKALEDYNSVADRAKIQLQNRDIDSDLAKRFGLQEGMDIWGVDPSKYYYQGAAPTRGAVASREQAAQIGALYGLAGKDNTYLPNIDESETYNPNKSVGFDTGRFLNDVRGQESLYNEAINRKAFGMTSPNSNGDASFSGSVAGMSPEQVAANFGVSGVGVDSGYIPGSVMDNLNALNNEISGQGSDPRYWTTQRSLYEAQRDQFQNLLNALQNKYHYGDKLK